MKALTQEARDSMSPLESIETKLAKEGSQLSENIGQLKLLAEDGKMRLTDVADKTA